MSGCNGGECGAKPTELAHAAVGCGSLKIAYAGHQLYWADRDHGIIESVEIAEPIPGLATTAGALTPLATGEASPTQILISMGNVYWINSGNQTVRTIKSTGGMVTTLATGHAGASGPGVIRGLAASPDGASLYYAQDTCIYTVSTSGPSTTKACAPPASACETIAGSTCLGSSIDPNGLPSALAVDANNLYYTADSSANIESMSLASGLPIKVAQSQGSLLLDTIFVKGGHIYWVNGGAILDNTAFIAGPDAGLGGQIITSEPDTITAFAIGNANVYYAMEGYIKRLPLTAINGAAPYVIARNVRLVGSPPDAGHASPASSIALDGARVYFAAANCQVLSLVDGPQ
jgi:hypothetical protein